MQYSKFFVIRFSEYAQSGGAAAKRIKILSGLAAQFGGNSVQGM